MDSPLSAPSRQHLFSLLCLLLLSAATPCLGFALTKHLPASSSRRRDPSLFAGGVTMEPTTTETLTSSSGGVSLTSVQSHLDELYPPSSLAGRNALSRTDGYWPYIQQGQEPPTELTYGEFDVNSLAQLLEEALAMSSCHASSSAWDNKVFTDIGSGTGRMVLAAAALYPSWRLCRGIELLPRIHDTAVEIAQTRDKNNLNSGAHHTLSSLERARLLASAPIQLDCGSFVDVPFHDSHVIFCFSTCMAGDTMTELADAIVKQCNPGTIVITTDYSLPSLSRAGESVMLELVKSVETQCDLIGGKCIAYFHKVVESQDEELRKYRT